MFQYEFEKPRPFRPDSHSWPTDSRSSVHPDSVVSNHSRRALPLPPTSDMYNRVPTKPSVPLKVWIIASASCFAVCAALVLATVVITKWGTSDVFSSHGRYIEEEAMFSNPQPVYAQREDKTETEESSIDSEEIEKELQLRRLENLPLFKNIVANRESTRNDAKTKKTDALINKPQIHPLHDTTYEHAQRKIEKKDQVVHPSENEILKNHIPDFKPTLPDVFMNRKFEIKFPNGFTAEFRNDFDTDYYNDENLYDDYMQSNSMTSYLIEKVQELHDWITNDDDFDVVRNATKSSNKTTEFTQVLKALNESLIEGNVTIIMNKLKNLYFGENYTQVNHTRKVILSNSTDLLSFGILSLDVMLLHNIQLMAWENQESARNKMLKDPDVFAFNALFLDPAKIETKHNEVYNLHDKSLNSKRQNIRQEAEDFDIGKNLLDNILEIGISSARAAIHLGRAYKSTKQLVTQLSNREPIHTQISRNLDANSHALNHLRSSYDRNETQNLNVYTELDCVWLLYCRNLIATSKLNAPYGTMARINGMALRMLTGELSSDRALDTMLYETMTGFTELRCNDMFPRCSKVDAANVVLESIMSPLKKTTPKSR